jgi:uncharacterized protein with PIN domain
MTKTKMIEIESHLDKIRRLELIIKESKHEIQIVKTERKLEHLRKGGELCSTCNGLLIFRYGAVYSDHFWAQCEDCKQTVSRKEAGWTDNPDEWPPNGTISY